MGFQAKFTVLHYATHILLKWALRTWQTKEPLTANNLSHSRHLKSFSFLWIPFSCALRENLLENPRAHSVQVNSFRFKCTLLIWFFSPGSSEEVKSHNGQTKYFQFKWTTFMCFESAPLLAIFLEQYLHTSLLIPLCWELMWFWRVSLWDAA